MGKKIKVEIKLNEKEEALVHYEMEYGRNETIKKQARVLYYANKGADTISELCSETGYCYKTVTRMLELYETIGTEAIYKCKRGKRRNHLDEIAEELEAYFDENAPNSVPDAVRKIKEKFGVNITDTPVRNWLKAKAIHTKNQKAYR